MSITIFDDTHISKRLSDYQKTRNQRDVHSSEEHKNSYEIGLDIMAFMMVIFNA